MYCFCPSWSSFSTIFLRNCFRAECLRTTTCLRCVAGVSKGMLPVKFFCSTKPPCVIEFNGDHKTVLKDEVKSGHHQFWGYYRISNSGVCLYRFIVVSAYTRVSQPGSM